MVLGDADVNIVAIQGFSRGRESIVQFVPNNPDKTAAALKAAGITYTSREVLIVKVLSEACTLGDVALGMTSAGITIDSVYVTTAGHVVLAVDRSKGSPPGCRGDDRHGSGITAAADEPSSLASQASSRESSGRFY